MRGNWGGDSLTLLETIPSYWLSGSSPSCGTATEDTTLSQAVLTFSKLESEPMEGKSNQTWELLSSEKVANQSWGLVSIPGWWLQLQKKAAYVLSPHAQLPAPHFSMCTVPHLPCLLRAQHWHGKGSAHFYTSQASMSWERNESSDM